MQSFIIGKILMKFFFVTFTLAIPVQNTKLITKIEIINILQT